MQEKVIYSENPINDIWLSIEKYSYSNNIEKYLSSRSLPTNSKLSESISGAILQASDFFKASKYVTIQIAPILLYYGLINLLFASSALITGEIPKVKSHGLCLKKENIPEKLLQSSVIVFNKENGGFFYYFRGLKKEVIDRQEEWTIQECLSAIPELTIQFISQFGSKSTHIIPLDRVITDENTSFIMNYDIINLRQLKTIIKNDSSLGKNYFMSEYGKKVVFKKKLNGNNLYKRSYTGQYYFPVSFNRESKFGKKPSGLFSAYIALFGLCTLCRYYPYLWTPYIRLDPSGDVNFIKLFLSYVQRYIPNIVLDYVENVKHLYTSSLIVPIKNK